ncbi:hypothetical protein FRB97_002420, partial [Tulasnella sp. 331]
MKLPSLLTLATALFPVVTRAYTNPVAFYDLADLDVRNVNGTYYYSASTMHYSPGAPILRSYDLVNWDIIGHSVPTLNWGNKYSLIGGQAYVKGIYASWFNYNPHDGQWYWGGCIEYSTTYVYTAPAPQGPWTQHAVFEFCLYDSGLLIDDDGTPYVSYKGSTTSVATLSKDFTSIVSTTAVYTLPAAISTAEGTRMHKVNGYYYIFTDYPNTEEWVLRSTSPTSGYTLQQLTSSSNASPVSGGSPPAQGTIVQANSGQWYYMSFTWTYPLGRIPILTPMSWTSAGWPSFQLVNGDFAATYTDTESIYPSPPLTGTDTFAGTSLGPRWEWNHNPDTTKFSVNNALILQTATVTVDLYAARNTLTQRIPGQVSTATIKMDVSEMADGDRAGLAFLRDTSGWIGASKDTTGVTTIRVVTGLAMNADWSTLSTGATQASAAFTGSTVWLRATGDMLPSSDHKASFSYSTDGSTFTNLGTGFAMNTTWEFFLGYRFAIFNYATVALGGQVTVSSYTTSATGYVSGEGTYTGSTTTLPSNPTTTVSTATGTTTSPVTTTSTTGGASAEYGQCG